MLIAYSKLAHEGFRCKELTFGLLNHKELQVERVTLHVQVEVDQISHGNLAVHD